MAVALLVINAASQGILRGSVGEIAAALPVVEVGSVTTVENLGTLLETVTETVGDAVLRVEGLGIWRGIVTATGERNVLNAVRQGIMRGSVQT